MKKDILMVIAVILSQLLFLNHSKSQDTTSRIITLNEVVISANRINENSKYVAQPIQVIKSKDIQLTNAQSVADLLMKTTTLTVQKSQQGGGSPMIRGFEASRVLLMIDGVRMNNLIYRSGHLQNVITLDQSILERAEVLYGPSSTVYGSDALGGVIHFYTRNPQLAADNNLLAKGNAYYRYGKVNSENTVHFDLNIGDNKLGSLTSLTYSKFGDLKMGTKINPSYGEEFGLRKYYAERINGKDSLIANSDPLVQKFSGYSQYDVLQKFIYRPKTGRTHLLNLQYSTSTDIPRYDRLTDASGSGLKNAEWYYGPQVRLLAAYNYEAQNIWGLDNLKLTLSYQDVEESRHDRKFGKSKRNDRIENVGVYGYTLAALKKSGQNEMWFGLDGQLSTLKSTASSYNVKTGEITPLDTRYPDGDNMMHQASLYFSHNHKFDSKFVITDGIRIGYSQLKSTFVTKDFFPLPYDEVKQNHLTYSANLGGIWLPTEKWKIALNLSTGYRVPNIDDLSKVFESVAGSKLMVPNPDLKPEKTISADLAINKQFSNRVVWENSVFYTYYFDAIVTDVFTFNGQDSVMYNGEMSRVYASQNKQKAFVYGASSGLRLDAGYGFSLAASVNYVYGRIITDTTNAPLDHIPPLAGRIGIRYTGKKLNAEFYSNFNGWKHIEDYLKNAEDNENYATPDGMPSWYTLNLAASYKFCNYFTLQAGIDNIMDLQYRVFASGINAPGRNIFVTGRFSF